MNGTPNTRPTFTSGDQVVVSVPAYSIRKGSSEQVMTVERVTPTGRLRLSDGNLYRWDANIRGGAFVHWRTGAMGTGSCAEVLRLA